MAEIKRLPVTYGADETMVDAAARLKADGLVIDGRFPGGPGAIDLTAIPAELTGWFRLQARVRAIKARFGAALRGHPDYRPLARHSTNPDIYMPARAPFLAGIAARAKADRERNPAWQRAQTLRAAIGA